MYVCMYVCICIYETPGLNLRHVVLKEVAHGIVQGLRKSLHRQPNPRQHDGQHGLEDAAAVLVGSQQEGDPVEAPLG